MVCFRVFYAKMLTVLSPTMSAIDMARDWNLSCKVFAGRKKLFFTNTSDGISCYRRYYFVPFCSSRRRKKKKKANQKICTAFLLFTFLIFYGFRAVVYFCWQMWKQNSQHIWAKISEQKARAEKVGFFPAERSFQSTCMKRQLVSGKRSGPEREAENPDYSFGIWNAA